MNISNLISELKRRNVFKVATAYAIAGWIIIQVSDTVFPRMGLPDWTITFIISLVLFGFPIAVIIAWAFELTPGGLKKSEEVDITESVTTSTGKKLNGIIMTSLGVLVILLLSERIFFAESTIFDSGSADIENASIAVLPFTDLSPEGDQEYFSDGLSEELLNVLAKVENMKVAGRTSSFKFKGQNENLTLIGDELGVKHILEGSVRKAGNRLRITAQLIKVDDGFHVWSETYDREYTAENIFDIQDEISKKVLEELKVRLLPDELVDENRLPTNDIEAYNAFLEGTQLEVDRQAENIKLAIEKYKEAIRIDPTFANAYARLAFAYNLLQGYGDMPIEEARFEIRRNVDQALLLDENQGIAYQALAYYYLGVDRNLEKAEEAGLKAIELAPNDPFSYNSLALVYRLIRRGDERDSLWTIAYDLDPLNPVIAANYTIVLVNEQKHQEALNLLDKIMEDNPTYTSAIDVKVHILKNGPYGQLDEAFKLSFELYKENPKDLEILNELFYLSNDLELNGLKEYFNSETVFHYPNNFDTQDQLNNIYLEQGEFEKAEQLVNQWIEDYGADRESQFIGLFGFIYREQGKYQQWIDLVEKYHQGLTETPPVIDPNYLGRSLNYSRILKIVGEEERSRIIEEAVVPMIQDRIEQLKGEGSLANGLNQEINLTTLYGNQERTLNILETLYFDMNEKIMGKRRMDNFYVRQLMEGNQQFEELKSRVEEDIKKMRDNVINWLKAEGEWKEEWDSE